VSVPPSSLLRFLHFFSSPSSVLIILLFRRIEVGRGGDDGGLPENRFPPESFTERLGVRIRERRGI
jgi:hypothetical protein